MNKMMTIINTNKFFWSKIQKNLFFFVLVVLFAGCAKKESLQIDSFPTNSGWGYTIEYKNKTIIKQSVIPVITDNKSFASQEDALKVGNLVMQKLKEHSSPTVTKNDLILLKIKF